VNRKQSHHGTLHLDAEAEVSDDGLVHGGEVEDSSASGSSDEGERGLSGGNNVRGGGRRGRGVSDGVRGRKKVNDRTDSHGGGGGGGGRGIGGGEKGGGRGVNDARTVGVSRKARNRRTWQLRKRGGGK